MKGMRTLKQKKRNRLLAALLAVAMMFQMLPLMAFADEGTSPTEGKAWVNGTEYSTLLAAVEAAHSGDTIELDEGDYTLCGKLCDGTLCGKPSCNINPPHGEYEDASKAATQGKKLTFVGKGERTVWNIGLENPIYDGERNGDYSFDGADTVTFKNMTLDAGVEANYRGFIRANNTVVENCVINGRTAYWGYTSAMFKDTIFNAPDGPYSYAIWTYCSPVMTFDHCTFNAPSGKAIYVYSQGAKDITVNFNNCTVNEGVLVKQALNINDSEMKTYKYTINISGNNAVNAALDKTTCSRVFGFAGKQGNDTGRTEVYVNGKHVWGKKDGADKGELKTHEYSAGEAEHQVTTEKTKWETVDERNDVRDVTRTCQYCHRTETFQELASVYRLQYDLNGGTGAEGANYDDAFYHEKESVALAAAPSCEGYDFVCWKDAAGRTYPAGAEIVLQGDTVLTAQWGKEPSEKPAESGESGCGVVSTVLIATGATAIGYYAGTQVLKHCYGLPYWPGNRSALALMLWEDADRPMPVSTVLYPDVGQKERDMDLQHAARWAMENELIPDLNLDSSKPEEEQKFFPNYAVSRAWALHAWNKAQKLKKNA